MRRAETRGPECVSFMARSRHHGAVGDYGIGRWAGIRDRSHKGLVENTVMYGAMRLQLIGGNRVMKLEQISRQLNSNL